MKAGDEREHHAGALCGELSFESCGLPDFVVRMLLPFALNLRSLAPLLGRRFSLTSDKARQTLGFSPRPAAMTVVDCARSLMPV